MSSILNNDAITASAITNDQGFFLNRFSTIEIITPKDGDNKDGGLILNNDHLLEFDEGSTNVNLNRIVTPSGQVPAPFIKLSNTSISGEYENVVQPLTADCMSNQWADISGLVPIGLNTVLTKVSGALQWKSVSEVSIVLNPLYNNQILYNDGTQIGYRQYISNQYLEDNSISGQKVVSGSLSIDKLQSISGDKQFLSSQSGQVQYSTIISSDLSGALNPLVQALNTQTYIINSNIQNDTILGSKLVDYSVSTSKITPQDTNKKFLMGQSGNPVVYSNILNTDISTPLENSNFTNNTISGSILLNSSIDYQTKLTNQQPIISGLNVLSGIGSSGNVLTICGSVLTWQNPNYFQPNYLVSGLNQVSTYPSTNNSILTFNTSGVSSWTSSSGLSVQWNQITQVPPQISGISTLSFQSGKFLQSIASGWVLSTVKQNDQGSSIWKNDAAGNITYLTGTTSQLVSFDASNQPYSINQSTLQIGINQVSGISPLVSGLQLLSGAFGVSGQYLRVLNSSGVMGFGNPGGVQFSGTSNSIPYFGSGSVPQNLTTWVSGSSFIGFQSGAVQRFDLSGSSSTFITGDGSIQLLKSKSVLNSCAGGYDFEYGQPLSAPGIVNGVYYSISGFGNITGEAIHGILASNFSLLKIGSNSDYFYSSSIAKAFTQPSGLYTFRNFMSTVTWQYTIASSVFVKNIYEHDYEGNSTQTLQALSQIPFRKWAYKDAKTNHLCHKANDAETIKEDTYKIVGPMYEDINRLHAFHRCCEIQKDPLNKNQIIRTLNYQTFGTLVGLAVKQFYRKYVRERDELLKRIDRLEQRVSKLENPNQELYTVTKIPRSREDSPEFYVIDKE